MALANYELLALQWQPNQKQDRAFVVSAIVAVVVAVIIGIYISSIDVPEKPLRERIDVPERVAKFISKQEPKPVVVEPPKVKPPEPPKPVEKPKPEEKPVEPPPVRVERERPVTREPLTEAQEKAREVASQSGLLAHVSQLNDLIDTSDVGAQLRTNIRETTGSGAQTAAGHDVSVFTSNAAQGSGGVDGARYAAQAGTSQLSVAELTAAQQTVAASEEALTRDPNKTPETTQAAKSRVRSEEEVILVFDRHKGQLQSLYNRARRNNPALKGKLVLAVTIKPDGSVSKIDVVSSELNDQSLVDSLLARIRNFQFGARDVETITVSYPIEFLPH